MLGPLAIGRVVERYRVEELLGEGGTAVVYRVRHVHLDTDHALKVLTLGHAGPRLLLEGKVQAGLRHPNIVAVTDVLDLEGSWGLLMEYVPPPSLARWLADNGPPRLELAEQLFRGIVDAVRHAHAHGLVHRDLKPANVLIARGAQGLIPKVSDFGLVRLIDDDTGRHTRTGLAMGTPQYMAPEQFRDAKSVDRRADLFSLGCVLQELVTGSPAFEWTSLIGVYEAMLAGRRAPLPADLPERLRAAIDGCLVPDRDARIADCGTLLSVLDGGQRAPTLVPRGALASRPAAGPARGAPPSGAMADLLAADTATYLGDSRELGPTAEAFPPPHPEPPRAAETLIALPPGPAASAPPAPSSDRRAWIVGAIVVVAVLVTTVLLSRGPEPSAPAPEAPPAAAPSPKAADEATRAPPLELPPTVAALPPPSPRAVVPQAPGPAAPSRPTAVAAAPPTPAPSPPPAVAPDAAPSVASVDPPVEAVTPPPVDAQVRVTGALSAWLDGADGKQSLPGRAPPGEYTIWADFGAGTAPAGNVSLRPGDALLLTCSAAFSNCKVIR